MAFNGSGVYSLPSTSVTPAVGTTTISSTDFNTFTADLETALNLCLTEDGQNIPTANLPMGGYKHTGASAGVASGDYSTIGGTETVTGDKTFSGTIDFTGTISDNLPMANGKGIDFSATSDGSGTSTSEVFDDYEEGTWTPTIQDTSYSDGEGQTYSLNDGT